MRMMTESTDPISRLQLLLELTYWLPLVALLLSSLGLIALKRMSGRLPPWAERLLASSFYVVASSIATLVIGIEVLGWYALISYSNGWLSHPYSYGWLAGIEIILLVAWIEFPSHPVEVFIYGISFVALCAAQFVSARLLWRTLWRRGERQFPPDGPRQHLRALFLFFAFALAFAGIRSFLLWQADGHHLNLRIVRATSDNGAIHVGRCGVKKTAAI
jgi:hypothetical protein